MSPYARLAFGATFAALLGACSASSAGDSGTRAATPAAACSIQVTGAVAGTAGDCIASAQHLIATNQTTFQIASTASSEKVSFVGFSATLGSAPLSATSYTEAGVASAKTVVTTTAGDSYYQSIHDDADALIDQGKFALRVSDTGTSISAGGSGASDGNGWLNVHGTLNAELPADPAGTTTGSVAVEIGF